MKDILTMPRDTMTISEVAEALRVSKCTVQRKITQGLLKAELRRDGSDTRSKWLITKEQVSNYLERYK